MITMRASIVVFVLAGLGAVYLWQQKADEPKPAISTPVVQQKRTTAAVAATPAREPSEHNWMKRSLDRARDVRDQARAQTKESQDP
jgi:hypothetical protein